VGQEPHFRDLLLERDLLMAEMRELKAQLAESKITLVK